MLISHYFIFKRNYILPNFIYGGLAVTICTSSYVSIIGDMGKNKEHEGDDNLLQLTFFYSMNYLTDLIIY